MKEQRTPTHAVNGNAVYRGEGVMQLQALRVRACAHIYQSGLNLGLGFKGAGKKKKNDTCGWIVQFHISSRKYRDY